MTLMGPPARWQERWRLTGAGVDNVWHYLREILACPSGRLLLRGPNGTGKTTLLEALLPYLLNPKASALSSGRNRATSLESLMKAGSPGRRRTGYLWLSFTAPGGRDESGSEADEVHYGVRLEYAQGCNPAVVVVPFWAPVLPGSDLDNFSELDRDEFTGWLTSCGGEVFACPDDYVSHLAQSVFGSDAGTLKRLAKRIKKVRNPGLLAGMSPTEAEHLLRLALPTVSGEVMRVTGEALASDEGTRLRYARGEKTTGLLQDLAAAWTHAAARHLGDAAGAASACTRARARADEEAAKTATEAAEARERKTELSVLLGQLETLERTTGSRARALAIDAASSDVVRASQAALNFSRQHASDCELLQLRLEKAADCAAAVIASATTTAGRVDNIIKECSDAGAPVAVCKPVTVERADDAPLVRVGERSFKPAPTVTLTADEPAVETAVRSLHETQQRQQKRQDTAHVILRAYGEVGAALKESQEVRRDAQEAADRAEQAGARHRTNFDLLHDRVRALGTGVETWASSWSTALRTPKMDAAAVAEEAASWLHDAEFAGVVQNAADLREKVAAQAVTGADRARGRSEHHRKAAARAQRAARDAEVRATWWRSGNLPAFPGPAWLDAVDEARAFGAAVDWKAATVPPGPGRDVLEAAIAATGLLGAALTEHGVAHGVGWQVRADGPALAAPLSLASVLTAVPGHPFEAVAAAVLERIAYLPSAAALTDEGGAGLAIGADGTFRAGPLVGHPTLRGNVLPAAHIGMDARRAAAMREAATAQRECEALQHAAAGRLRAAQYLSGFARQVESFAESFPGHLVEEAAAAEATRAESARVEADARAEAARKDRLASEKEAGHRAALDQWRDQAAAFHLPDDPTLVEAEAHAAGRRHEVLGKAAEQMAGIRNELTGLKAAAQAAQADRAQAEECRAQAEESHRRAADAEAALEACRQRSDLSELDLEQAVAAADQAHAEAVAQLAAQRTAHTEAVGNDSDCARAYAEAVRRLEESRPAAEAALALVRERLAAPGLSRAVGWQGDSASPEGDWLDELKTRLSRVPEPERGLDECTDALRLHLREEPDDGWSLGYGPAPEPMPAHQLAFAGRRFSPPAAAEEAAIRRDQALAAYNAADAQTLQRFVLGRIPAAISTAWVELQDWVRDINAQMSLAAASSGVGVRIDVSVRKDLSPAVATIHELTCKVADADRTPEQQQRIGQSLLAVLRMGEPDLTDERPRHEERAGLLAEATDIRTWVTIKYLITRADGSQERWGARDVTISQGESRLIVLAPMLAALAADYRDLPSHAARLCALDEVPAEVDQQGRDGIAAYVESLDLDLICTSHHWDGSPGAWDGVDIYDLEKAADGAVIAFEEMDLYGPSLLHATGHTLPHPAGPAATIAEDRP
ncbi:SbcC/MukB-like Walker B domain-containing protein [Streptomyces sp. NBC_00724]|uniref:SbcC/MukB-like Walker B domain-containing protein n=1 Tax=Streptomyces sp. NBC_00724 TaxID=2975812 RepID=UPI002ED2830B|nr:hypothetical protein OHB17_42885 [Streptomyces sp. NBC_00724]